MAKYATLKAAIEEIITTNGNYEISGEDVRETLKAIVDSLGANYQLVGFATEETDPGTPDQNVAYLAGPGTYSNFGPTTVDKGQIGLFKYNGTWSYETIDCGVSIEYEEYPGGDAFEWTFYDSENPDGLTIKIAKTVSGLVNDPNVAISQWWAAQTERKINVLGGYTISIDSLTTSPQTLGLYKAIQTGQIIDSITGANKLIFGIDGGGSVTVNASDLPYKATANLINVRTDSGTANNVSIIVRGINDILPAYININEIANHPAAYADAATALADVPALYRRKGVKVVYYDDDTQLWIEMLCYDDAGGANWWTDVENNWAVEGPIETKIPTATGGQQLRIAGEKRGNLDDILNVNVWNEQITEYASQAAARAAVPANKRKLGAIITYLVSTGTDTSGWMIDEYIGSSISNWTVADNWKTIGPVSVSQNTNTGHTDISVGGVITPVASLDELGLNLISNVSFSGYKQRTINIPTLISGKKYYLKIKSVTENTRVSVNLSKNDAENQYIGNIPIGGNGKEIVPDGDKNQITLILVDVVSGDIDCNLYIYGEYQEFDNRIFEEEKKSQAFISKIKPYEFYFAGRKTLIVENSNSAANGIYFTPSQDAQLNVYEAGKGETIYSALNWAALASDISKSLITSPNGLANCIQLKSGDLLAFDTISKIPVVRTRTTLVYTDIVLIAEAGGRCIYIDGGLSNIVDKEPLFDIVKTIQPYTCYFTGRTTLIIEETNDNTNGLYFKPTNESAAFGLYGANDEQIINIANWAGVATALGKTFVISPNGLTNCLQLTFSECLILNTKSKTLSIKSRANLTATDVILLQVAGGRCLYVNQGLYNIIDSYEELPYWWESYMKTKIATINEKCNAVGCDGDNFVFITDIHNEHNYGNSPSLIKYILNNTPINNVVIGGDLLSDASSKADALTKIQMLRNKYDFTPYVFPILGNHDIDITGSIAITFGEYYSIMLHPLENIMTLNKLPYYYKDNESQKIRYIYLDGSDTATAMSNTQKTWLQNKMSELQTGWTIVIFCHTYWSANVPPQVSVFGASLVSAINEIIGNIDATLAVVVTGHTHRAMATQDTNGYWIVATPCDAGYGEASVHDDVTPTRTAKTTSEQVFDVFNINTNTKKIYITRIGGNGEDRELTYS